MTGMPGRVSIASNAWPQYVKIDRRKLGTPEEAREHIEWLNALGDDSSLIVTHVEDATDIGLSEHILLQGYTPKQLEFRTGGPSAVENLYTEAMLRELFSDWEIVSLREHEDTIEEGTAHVGRSALIDLVARKPTGR